VDARQVVEAFEILDDMTGLEVWLTSGIRRKWINSVSVMSSGKPIVSSSPCMVISQVISIGGSGIVLRMAGAPPQLRSVDGILVYRHIVQGTYARIS
jgi:hypothetical protein